MPDRDSGGDRESSTSTIVDPGEMLPTIGFDA
jgi:hypothetical protein